MSTPISWSRTPGDPTFAPFSAPIKELAFEIWAFQAGRNCAATARTLAAYLRRLAAEDEDILSHYELNSVTEITARHIERWKHGNHWETLAEERVNAIIPQLRFTTFREFFLGLPDAIESTRAISRGEFDDPKVAAVRLKANEIIFDRTGFTPRQETELPAPTAVKISLEELKDKSIEELMALDAETRDAEYTVKA